MDTNEFHKIKNGKSRVNFCSGWNGSECYRKWTHCRFALFSLFLHRTYVWRRIKVIFVVVHSRVSLEQYCDVGWGCGGVMRTIRTIRLSTYSLISALQQWCSPSKENQTPKPGPQPWVSTSWNVGQVPVHVSHTVDTRVNDVIERLTVRPPGGEGQPCPYNRFNVTE